MGQTPPVGQRLHHDSTVAVTVSRGPKPVKVPHLSGYTRYRAHKLLAGAHLRIGRISRTSSLTVPRYDIISATPSSGTLLPGRPVAIVISTGKPKITVPLLAGNAVKSYQAAAAALRADHLQPSETQAYNNTVPAGEVISTSPGAHSVVIYGSHVTVHVSRGPELVTVPDVTGDSVSQAQATLNYYGFPVSGVVGSSTQPVARTDPAVGQTVVFGSSVQIVTRTPPPPPTTTTTVPTHRHHRKSGGGGQGRKHSRH
ncbi:MAG TPA: PASTA domain-containing protein, partial [Acidimicrobiales bacterium]|nr:PASTA domain-containing protein [Acidimicrobiales bacterium]